MLNSSLPENSDILVISNSSTKNSVGKIIAPLTKLKDDRIDLSITLFGYPEWQTYTKEYLNNLTHPGFAICLSNCLYIDDKS